MKVVSRALSKILVVSTALMLAGAVPAYATGTVAQWNMDELAGSTMNDTSGTGNNGTITNVTLGATGFTGGVGDYAYAFDGTSSRALVLASTSLNPGDADVTITLHINTTFRPGTGSFDFDLVRKGSGFSVELYPKKALAQGKCKFSGTGGKLVLQAGPDLVDGAWHTIVCAKTSTGISLTVDGATFTKSGVVGNISNKSPVAVGWQTDSTDFYHGLMDDVSIVVA
ncbi:MAG: LamG-like jellyroll fold domain-containing protein [Actinomycetota bacterium]